MLPIGLRCFDGAGSSALASATSERRRIARASFAVLLWPTALTVLAAVAMAGIASGLDVEALFRDPVVTLGGHPLTGAISNLGVLVWCAAATICFFAAALLAGRRPTLAGFFVVSGIVTTVLLVDDFFLFHDDLARRWLGVKQRFVESAHVLVLVAYLVGFRRTILATDPRLLVVALVFFGASMTIDQLQQLWASPWRIAFEDGAKFLGIVAWLGYFAKRAHGALAYDERSFVGRS